MSRGYRDFLDPDGVRHGGLPTFPWRMAPEGLATRRQLAALGLRPNGQPIAAQVLWRSRRYAPRRQTRVRAAYLYRVDLAAGRRQPSPAQLAALETARRARRVCPTCGLMREYVIPASLGECLPCSDAWAARRAAA